MKTLITLFFASIFLVACNSSNSSNSSSSSSSTSSSNPQTEVAITFKDIPLGQNGVKASLIELCNKSEHTKSMWSCEFGGKFFVANTMIIDLSYGNLPFTLATIRISDSESLDSVEMSGSKSEMLKLVEILQEKYGSPKKTTKSVENGMGSKFDQEIFVWVDAKGNRITVESIHDKVDKGRVVIESATRIASREVEEKIAKELVKSNL